MRIDQLALLFALVIGANLVLLVALQLPLLGRRLGRRSSPLDPTSANGGAPADPDERDPALKGRRLLGDSRDGLPAALYRRVARVVSFMFMGSAMAIVVLTDAPNQTAIIVLLAFGLILIELFQDVLPASALGRWRLPIETGVALAFVTVLIVITGGHSSPYFFGYVLLVGGAGLASAGIGAVGLAVVSCIAYIVAVFVAAGPRQLTSADFGQVAFNLIAITLVMYVASVIGREQRLAHEKALRLSRFDSLTNLFSRDYLMAELEQELLRATRTGRPFALAMIDLDGLKAANDRFGHEWGDNLLSAVADVLRGDIRATDVAARYGGDEFVLMLPETDLAGAVHVADKVRVDIARVALPHSGAVVRTSASIGIVTFPDDGRSSAELMRRADLAMYEAKRRGRDQIVRFARAEPEPPPQVVTLPPGPSPAAPGARITHRYPVTSAVVAVGPGKPHEPSEGDPRPAADRRADVPPENVPPASPGRAPWEVG